MLVSNDRLIILALSWSPKTIPAHSAVGPGHRWALWSSALTVTLNCLVFTGNWVPFLWLLSLWPAPILIYTVRELRGVWSFDSAWPRAALQEGTGKRMRMGNGTGMSPHPHTALKSLPPAVVAQGLWHLQCHPSWVMLGELGNPLWTKLG